MLTFNQAQERKGRTVGHDPYQGEQFYFKPRPIFYASTLTSMSRAFQLLLTRFYSGILKSF